MNRIELNGNKVMLFVGKSNVGLGAFTIESMVPGESVTFTANPNYYKGRPNLDKVSDGSCFSR